MNKSKLVELLTGLPDDVRIESDSGWECDPTSVGMIVFSEKAKVMIMRQTETDLCTNIKKRLEYYNELYKVDDFELLYNGE